MSPPWEAAERQTSAIPLVVSVVALALSCLTLGWTITAFKLGGPRIKVEINTGWFHPLGVTIKKARGEIPANDCHPGALGMPVLALEAVNRGRMPIEVQAYGIETRTKRRSVSIKGAAMGGGMPRTVGAHGAETFHVPMAFVFERIGADPEAKVKPRKARTVRLWLQLSTGKTKRTKRVKFPEASLG